MFQHFYASQTDSAFKVLNDQGQCHTIVEGYFLDSAICLDMERSGALTVHKLFGTNTPLLLRVGHGGSGISTYRVSNVKLDAEQAERTVWLRVEEAAAAGAVHAFFDGGAAATCKNQASSGHASFQIRDTTILSVKNINGGVAGPGSPLLDITTTTTTIIPRYPAAVFENVSLSCRDGDLDPESEPFVTFNDEIVTLSGTAQRKYYQLHDCHVGLIAHQRLPDLGNLSAKRGGTTTITSGSATKVVDHNIFGAGGSPGDSRVPRIGVTANADPGGTLWVTSVSATQFTLNRSSTTNDLQFDWRATIDAGDILTIPVNLFSLPTTFDNTGSWSRTNLGGVNVTTDVDGHVCYEIVDNSTVAAHQLSQLVGGMTTTTTVVRFTLRADTLTKADIAVNNATVIARYDLSAGTAALTAGVGIPTISFDAASNGYVCELSYTWSAGAQVLRLINAAGSTAYAGTGQRVLIYRAELYQ